jgi:hypothetical protein
MYSVQKLFLALFANSHTLIVKHYLVYIWKMYVVYVKQQ